MVRGALAIVTFLAGLIAGGVVVATATSAPPASAAPPTPVPFVRYTAADVVAVFNGYGLYAAPPHVPGYDTFLADNRDIPLGSAQARSFLDFDGTGANQVGLGYVVVCTSPAELNAIWNYLLQHTNIGLFPQRSIPLHTANLILVFFGGSNSTPDYTLYQAAFMTMR